MPRAARGSRSLDRVVAGGGCRVAPHPMGPLGGVHRQARAVLKYWPGLTVDVPVIMLFVCQLSKSYEFCAAIQFPRQSARHSSCATEGRPHSAVLEQGC